MGAPMARASLTKKLSLAIGLPAALAVAAELGLRLAGFEHPPVQYARIVLWNPAQDAAMEGADDVHQADPLAFWSPRPGGRVQWSERGERINAEGYRGPLVPAEHDGSRLRVATMGDSSTFGLGVEYDETFSARLQAELERRGVAAEVLDFGVIGYTVLQGVVRYSERVRHFHPDVVVSAFGAVNEQWPTPEGADRQRIAAARGRTSDWYAFTQEVRKRLRLAHLVAYWRLQAEGGMRARHQAWVRPREEFQKTRDYSGRADWDGVRRVGLDDYRDGLGSLQRAVEADGARLVLIAMPRRPVAEEQRPVLLEYTRVTREFARDRELEICDAHALFQSTPDGLSPRELFREENGRLDNWHPTPAGHELIARCLADAVIAATEGDE